MAFNYTGKATYNYSKQVHTINTYQVDTGTVRDTLYNTNSAGFISHTPSLSITPKFGHFNLNPNINLGANNYFRKMIRTYNAEDSTTTEEFQRGFFTEYFYSTGIGVSTTLYGIADSRRHLFGLIDPNTFGVKAVRHTYKPSVNFNYTPDFSTDKHNFYGRYFNEERQREEKYSFFDKEGGTHASSSLQKRLSYSDRHTFEIKKQGKDTLPDVNMELLIVTLSL